MTTSPPEIGAPRVGHRAKVWFRHLPTGGQILVVVIAIVLVLNVGSAALRTVLGTDPGGPTSSTYGTAGDGLAALADLLEAEGIEVIQLQERLDRATLDPATTLVIAEPLPLEVGELDAIERFVIAGGRLVMTGDPTLLGARAALAETPDGDPGEPSPGEPSPGEADAPGLPVWSPAAVASPALPVAPVPEVAGISEVETGRRGSWAETGPFVPILASEDRVVAAVGAIGSGRLVAVADPTIWQNELLAERDNAAFALAALGSGRRTVVFAEAAHGIGGRSGLGAFPVTWRWTLAGFALAALLAIWSRGHRFGPAERPDRLLPPPRRAYVDAIAITLAKTSDPRHALDPLRDRSRRIVADATGLPADAPFPTIREAAIALGHDPALVDLLDPQASSDDPVAIGLAAASIARDRRPTRNHGHTNQWPPADVVDRPNPSSRSPTRE